MDETRNIKIIDFGFGLIVPYDQKLTMFCGTLPYMAPEIISKKNYYGQPADVWALGVILYLMASGVFPFKGLDDKEINKKIMNCEYEKLQNSSSGLQRLIDKILIEDPLQRLTTEEVQI